MNRKLIIVISLILISTICNGQKRHAINITTNEGLPTTSIRAFHKDSRGYLWIGTDAGVVKFDGLEMSVFNSYNGLPGEKVWDIDEDWNGDMWFACFGEGIARFDGNHITTITKKDGLPDNAIRKFTCHYPSKTYLFGTGFTCGFLNEDLEIKKLEDYYHPDSLRNTYTEILLDSTSAIYLCHSNKEYAKLFFDTDSITPVKSNWMTDYKTSSGYIRNNNDTIITNERIGIVIKSDSSLSEIGGMGQVFGMTEDDQNNLWIAGWNEDKNLGDDGGLFCYDGDEVIYGNNLFNIQTHLGWIIKYDSIQPQIYFGTLDKGIYTFSLPFFTLYNNSYFNEKELSIEEIVCRNNKEVFAISNNTLLHILPTNKYEKLTISELANLQLTHSEKSQKEISSAQKTLLSQHKNNPDYFNYVSISKATNNDILVSCNHLNPIIITSGFNNEIEICPETRHTIILDENDTISTCCSWSLKIYKYGHYKNIQSSPKEYDLIDKDFMAQKHFTYQNETWLCSRITGVFIEKDCSIRDLNEEDSTINHLVNAICFDSTGTAYLGGNDGRIEVLSPVERKKIFEISHKKTLPAVLWAHIWKGHLFAGHADGLRIYNLQDIFNGNYSYRFFGETEGNVYRNVNNSDIDEDGNMWLATTDGVVKVDANLILNTKYYPLKSVIDKVELFNKETDWSQYGETDRWSKLPAQEVTLPYDDNNLSIYYHTLNFVNHDAEEYYYKLEGIDDEWNGPTKKNYVVYPFLKSGEYTFRAKSRNHTSGITSTEAVFSFTILKPWYFQLWFIISMSIILLCIITILYRLRIRNIRRQENQKREIMTRISDLETKALQAQMNPHFIFNSMSSIQNFVIDNDVDEALTFMGHFSKVIRMTLDNVDSKTIPLQDELDYITHYTELEKMRFDDSFEFNLDVGKEVDVYNTPIPPMLLQPIIENCIKHAFADRSFKGRISLTIKGINEDSYQCIIEDNGIGRAAAEKNRSRKNLGHTSKGMKITRDRIRMLNEKNQEIYSLRVIDLHDDKNNATGTRVEIVLPLGM